MIMLDGHLAHWFLWQFWTMQIRIMCVCQMICHILKLLNQPIWQVLKLLKLSFKKVANQWMMHNNHQQLKVIHTVIVIENAWKVTARAEYCINGFVRISISPSIVNFFDFFILSDIRQSQYDKRFTKDLAFSILDSCNECLLDGSEKNPRLMNTDISWSQNSPVWIENDQEEPRISTSKSHSKCLHKITSVYAFVIRKNRSKKNVARVLSK